MPSSILQRTFSSVTDQRIVLSSSNFMRSHGLLTSDWLTLRVGIRFSFNNIGATLSGARFFVGLVNAAGGMPLDVGCTNFVGIGTNGSFSYTAPGTSNAYYSATLYTAQRVANGAFNFPSTLATSFYPSADATLPQRRLFFADFTKNTQPAGTISFKAFYPGSTQAASADVDQAAFIRNMESSSPSLSGHQTGSGTAVTVNEAPNGIFDSICIGWNLSSATLEICDLALARLA